MTPPTAIRPCTPADEATFRAHYDHYLEELVAHGGSYRRDASGRWEPDYLPYWLTPGDDHHVFVFDGGFALVMNAASPYITPGLDFLLSEHYVAPAHRRRGVGAAAARAIFALHPGLWGLAVIPGNTPAMDFWRRALRGYSVSETVQPEDTLFRFDSRLTGS